MYKYESLERLFSSSGGCFFICRPSAQTLTCWWGAQAVPKDRPSEGEFFLSGSEEDESEDEGGEGEEPRGAPASRGRKEDSESLDDFFLGSDEEEDAEQPGPAPQQFGAPTASGKAGGHGSSDHGAAKKGAGSGLGGRIRGAVAAGGGGKDARGKFPSGLGVGRGGAREGYKGVGNGGRGEDGGASWGLKKEGGWKPARPQHGVGRGGGPGFSGVQKPVKVRCACMHV